MPFNSIGTLPGQRQHFGLKGVRVDTKQEIGRLEGLLCGLDLSCPLGRISKVVIEGRLAELRASLTAPEPAKVRLWAGDHFTMKVAACVALGAVVAALCTPAVALDPVTRLLYGDGAPPLKQRFAKPLIDVDGHLVVQPPLKHQGEHQAITDALASTSSEWRFRGELCRVLSTHIEQRKCLWHTP